MALVITGAVVPARGVLEGGEGDDEVGGAPEGIVQGRGPDRAVGHVEHVRKLRRPRMGPRARPPAARANRPTGVASRIRCDAATSLARGGARRWRTLAAWFTCESLHRRAGRHVLQLSEACASVINVSGRPPGPEPDRDVNPADVAREDVSVALADLRRMGLHHSGSTAVDQIDTVMFDAAIAAERAAGARPGTPGRGRNSTERTPESAELSASFLAFMVIATVIASIGVILESAILIVGAMVVGPEFGPIAGVC